MKKRFFSFALATVVLFGCFTNVTTASASEENNMNDVIISEEDARPMKQSARIFPRQESAEVGEWDVITMQGNTLSASDCRTFESGLLDRGNEYVRAHRVGWSGNDVPDVDRVTLEQLRRMYGYDVAYYSGHGGCKTVNGVYHPFVNFKPSNLANDYGNSSPIDVANVFMVDGSDWKTTSYLEPADPIKVLFLASCYQLDTKVMKYYARMMKASGIRAIAGYHDVAPSTEFDAKIATDFVKNAADGNSVWYSWQHANSGFNWAVLVYQSYGNQYYRMPGFKGNRYDAPDKTQSVYRYANFLSPSAPVPTSIEDSLMEQIADLPLTITTSSLQTRAAVSGIEREIVHTTTSVVDDGTLVWNYLTENGLNDASQNTILVQHYVACDEIDEDEGLLEDSRVIVERTYDYYDTYSGVKIADSFVSASIDCEGVKNISDSRKVVISAGGRLAENARSINLISEAEAIEIAQSEDTCCDYLDVYGIALAYAPTENGEHTLCYEVTSDHGFCYVDVQTGDIIHFT